MLQKNRIWRKYRSKLAIMLVFFMIIQSLAPMASALAAKPDGGGNANTITAYAYNVQEVGQGKITHNWGPGNAGTTYEEGEYLACQTIIENVDWNQLNEIAVEYDFYDANTNSRFYDLVRDISVGTTQLTDEQGFPMGDGSAYQINDMGTLNKAQRKIEESTFTKLGFQLIEFGTKFTEQINRPITGTGDGTETDQTRMFYVTQEQLIAALLQTTDANGNRLYQTKEEVLALDKIVLYFQLHLSRTVMWNYSNNFDTASGPATLPIAYLYSDSAYYPYKWGGYLYTEEFLSGAKMNGSGSFPGSSGHSYVFTEETGKKTLPIPDVPEAAGMISGMKFNDLNGNGVYEPELGEMPITDWKIYFTTTLSNMGSVEGYVLTGSDGRFTFTDLTYDMIWEISEELQVGYQQTYPTALNASEDGIHNEDPTLVETSWWRDYMVMAMEGRAAGAWSIKLAPDHMTQTTIDFGNIINNPDTALTIAASAPMIYAGKTVDLTIVEKNSGDVPLSDVRVEISGATPAIPDLTSTIANPATGDGGVIGILEKDESWTWILNDVQVNATTTFTANGFGNDPLGNEISFAEGFEDEQDAVEVKTINPNTDVGITTSAAKIYEGKTVTLTVTEENTGDDPLTGVHAVVSDGLLYSTDLLTAAAVQSGGGAGADNSDNVLSPGEIMTWKIPDLVVNADTTFTVKGYGTDSLSGTVAYDDTDPENIKYVLELATVDVDTIKPDTAVGITTNPEVTMIYNGGTVNLVVTETNTGNDPISGVYVVVSDGGSYNNTLLAITANESGGAAGTNHTDGILAIGETMTWTISDLILTADTTFTAKGYGTDTLGGTVAYDATDPQNIKFPTELATIQIDTIKPGTDVNITSTQPMYYAGTLVNFTVTENNTGEDPLTNVRVEVKIGTDLIYTLTKDTAGVVQSGGPAGTDHTNAILESGEAWTWDLSRIVYEDTTFIALGYGTDPLGNEVSYAADSVKYELERDTVLVNTITPNTVIDITTSKGMIYAGETVTLTITETNTGDDSLTGVHAVVSDGGSYSTDLLAATAVESGTQNAILEPGETMTWTITNLAVSADTTFTVNGYGTDSMGGSVAYDATDPTNIKFASERDTVAVDTIAPNTQVTIGTNPVVTVVYIGDAVNLVVTETNTGDDPIQGVYVVVSDGVAYSTTLQAATAVESGGAGANNANDILEPGETMTWTIANVVVNSTTTFTANGFGTDSLGGSVAYNDADPTNIKFALERASITIEAKQEFKEETAWAYLRTNEFGGKPIPFKDVASYLKNWGWTNGPFNVTNPTTLIFDLYTGVSDNDPTGETPVGTVTVTFNANNTVTVVYETEYAMGSTPKFYIGSGLSAQLPIKNGKYCNSPGQFKQAPTSAEMTQNNTCYTMTLDFSARTELYIAAHAVVNVPVN